MDVLDISRNPYVKDLSLLPDLINLSKLTAEYCQIKNLNFIDSKFESLNIANFRNNKITLYKDVEGIKEIDYLGKKILHYSFLNLNPYS